MAIRLTCNVANTKELLGHILQHSRNGERVMFLDEPGRGGAKMQACRVRLSRVRNSLKNQARKRKYFMLHNSIHPYTDESGKRWDCVIVWQSQNQRHKMIESLEDLVGNGESL